MKLEITVYTGVTEEGQFKPGDIVDIREGTAEEWIKRGWAIDKTEKKSKPEPQPEKAAEIETPEDATAASKRETATLKRKKK